MQMVIDIKRKNGNEQEGNDADCNRSASHAFVTDATSLQISPSNRRFSLNFLGSYEMGSSALHDVGKAWQEGRM
jgi:hypothetical protein